jgi:hypothetical protein
MEGINYFVPGEASSHPGLLNGLLPTWQKGITIQYLEAYTAPGDLVVTPFATSGIPLCEVQQAGRRIIAVTNNPLLHLDIRFQLQPCRKDTLQRLLNRLGDMPKGGMPLHRALIAQYAAVCPECREQAVCEYSVWGRDSGKLYQQFFRCPACRFAALIEGEEAASKAGSTPESRGLHYYFLLDRLAARDDPMREQAAALMNLYSQRNLYVIAELIMKIEAGFSPPDQLILKQLLLRCLLKSSSLMNAQQPAEFPARLKPPRRYVEHNVWLLLQEAALAAEEESTPVPPAGGISEVLESPTDEARLAFLPMQTAQLARQLPTGSVRLVLTALPPNEAFYWSLGFLWAGWLFGREQTEVYRNVLRTHPPEWEWYAHVLGLSLQTLRPCLSPAAHLIFAFESQALEQITALNLAALKANLSLQSWQYRGLRDQQLIYTPSVGDGQVITLDSAGVLENIRLSAEAAVPHVLQERGEPLADPDLRLAAWRKAFLDRELAPDERFLSAGKQVAPLLEALDAGLAAGQGRYCREIEGEGELPAGYWLRQPGPNTAAPLADRLENLVYEALSSREIVRESEVSLAACRQFSGQQTPPLEAIRANLQAYADQEGEVLWQLRSSETPEAWSAIDKEVSLALAGLAGKLGCRTSEVNADMTWLIDEEHRAGFCCIFFAGMHKLLPDEEPHILPYPERYVLIPAARAPLWAFRLATMPWLSQSMAGAGWRFIKLEYLLQLAEEPLVTWHDMKTIIGLEPLAEHHGQMALF